MSGEEDRKPTVQLAGQRQDEKKTVEIATLPIILEEVRMLRREGRDRGERADSAIKNLAIVVQSNFEQHGGKIRALEIRVQALEDEKNKWLALIEEEKKKIYVQIAALKGVSPDDIAKLTQHVSLGEEAMAAKLAAEANERAAVETKVDMLSTMLVQGLGLRPPPLPLPDGSMPPAPEGKKKREPKNTIEKQTFWTKVAAVMGGVVVMAGTLDKMGAFEELGKLVSKAFGH